MKLAITLILASMLAACGGGGSSGAPAVTVPANASASSATVTVTSWDSAAGAIGSLTWGGCEFVNTSDRGRFLQSAYQLDGQGEAINPTEAGSSADGGTSSSVLIARTAAGGHLTTSARMAFWHPVGGVTLSDHVMQKDVQVGYGGNPNVIRYDVAFNIPAAEHRTNARFEFLTGYMPPTFAVLQTLAPSGELATLTYTPGTYPRQGLPLVFSTADGACAMGVVTPQVPHDAPADPQGDGYEYYRFADCVKWAMFAADVPNPTGDYRYTAYLFVGTREQVRADMLNFPGVR